MNREEFHAAGTKGVFLAFCSDDIISVAGESLPVHLKKSTRYNEFTSDEMSFPAG